MPDQNSFIVSFIVLPSFDEVHRHFAQKTSLNLAPN
jgi:hypothetical protein